MSHNSLATPNLHVCTDCGLGLPIRFPWPDEQPRTWFCAKCGGEITGLLDYDAPEESHRNVQPKMITIDTKGLQLPPQAVVQFLERLVSPKMRVVEKRLVPRHPLVTVIPAVPVDAQFRPIGDTFMATARNLSTLGIGLVHVRPVESKYLVLELRTPVPEIVQVAMRVVRCRPLGPYFDIAGDFISRLVQDKSVVPELQNISTNALFGLR